MDNDTPQSPIETNPEIYKLSPNPFAKATVIWDTSYAYTHDEEQINGLLQIGFEPYSVTMEIDPRKDAQAKAKLSGQTAVAFRQWFRRPREIQPEFQAT